MHDEGWTAVIARGRARMRMEPRTEVSDAQRSVPSHETVGQPASSSTSQFWGPGQIVDPNLSGEGGGSSGGGSAASAPKILGWTYAPKHVLPRWGRGGDDLAAVGLAEALEFDVLVTSSGACVRCGSTRHVRVQRHHPGGCGAFEWTHGLDIDWRWTCCGRHESFSHGRRCAPAGSHATGCVEAPLCTACFVCPCVRLIAARKAQEEDM